MVEEKAVEAGQFTQPAPNEGALANTGYFQPHQLAELEKMGRLYLVADGLGGAASQVASHYAIRKVLASYYNSETHADPQERLLEVIQQVNAEIFDRNTQQPERRPMVTTLTAALVHQSKLIVARVGDGQVYVVWDQDIERLTQEMGSVEAKVAEPEVETSKEAAVRLIPAKVESPPNNLPPAAKAVAPKERLPQGLGVDKTVKIDVFARRLFAGDVVILCSGGLNGYITDKEIARAVTRHPPDLALQRLAALAKERGSYEHIALSLTRILSNSVIVHPPDPMPLPLAPKWSEWLTPPKPANNHLDTHPTQPTPANATQTQPLKPIEPKRERTPSDGLPTINWRGQQRYPEWRWYTYALIALVLVGLCAAPVLAWNYFDPPRLLASMFLSDEPGVVAAESVAEKAVEPESAFSPTATITLTVTAAPAATASPVSTAITSSTLNSPVATPQAQVVTPVSTPTGVASSTLIVNTPTPSPTPGPTIELPAGCESKARFAGDVTIPDGTQFASGETFDKIWRLQNAGTCPWGPGYSVRFIGGDAMGPTQEALLAYVVEPETQGQITVSLVAPEEPGTYRGNWQMFDLNDQPFGPEMYLEIEVLPAAAAVPTQVNTSTATILYDFIENAANATWSSGTTNYTVRSTAISETLELPAPEGLVALGIAQLRGNEASTEQALLTYPHQELGLIEGTYPITTPLQPTDNLVATLGFTKLSILSDDGVIFEVGFTPEGGQERLLLSRPVQYQESPVSEVIPLNNIQAGQTGTFTLRVRSGKSLSQDWALWQDLRLIRP